MNGASPEIEPELQGSIPRRVRYTAGTQISRLVLLLLLVGGVWLISWLGTRDLKDLTALRSHGEQIQAQVIGEHKSHGKSTTYYVDYSFMGSGELVDSDEDVSRSTYYATHPGDTLLVTYLPTHPKTHRVGVVDGARVTAQRIRWTIGTLVTLAVFGLILWAVESNRRRHRQLLAEGMPVQGIVTDHRMIQGKNTTYYVTYQFPGPAGTLTKKITVSRSFYHQNNPGTPLTVLYHPVKPTNNQPYRALTDVRLG